MQYSCLHCRARELSEWCVLTDSELKTLDKGSGMREYSPGEIVFYQGDLSNGIYCIESGLVGLRMSDTDGNETLLHLLNGGNTMGYRAFLTGQEYGVNAEVFKPSRICHINSSTVTSLVHSNPNVGLRFLLRASNELDQAEKKIIQNANWSVRARFAHLLMVFVSKQQKKPIEDEVEITLPIPKHEIASMIGTTPETLSRTIKSMEKDGVARFSQRTVQIRFLKRLTQEFDPGLSV